MHSELVKNRSTSSVVITGPAAAGPSSVASSGTPMKPVFGQTTVSAPSAASFIGTASVRVRAIVATTSTTAVISVMTSTTGFRTWATGSEAPNRNSMQGSAKYRTNRLSPGIVASGRIFERPARYPHSTSAKNGIVTAKMACMDASISGETAPRAAPRTTPGPANRPKTAAGQAPDNRVP